MAPYSCLRYFSATGFSKLLSRHHNSIPLLHVPEIKPVTSDLLLYYKAIYRYLKMFLLSSPNCCMILHDNSNRGYFNITGQSHKNIKLNKIEV